MLCFCSDLEGVWVPEVWVNVARVTGIDELKLTTRDINDYDVLMKRRISILEQHGLTIQDIQSVISQIDPLLGAVEMLNWVRSVAQIIIVSDTFTEFAQPLMQKLQYPTLFCNYLSINNKGMVEGYHLRQPDQKREVVQALKNLKYKVVAFGDSYNDISMLKEADEGFLYCPPQNVANDYPLFPIVKNYEELKVWIQKYL